MANFFTPLHIPYTLEISALQRPGVFMAPKFLSYITNFDTMTGALLDLWVRKKKYKEEKVSIFCIQLILRTS
jgi:hypothetical protein